MKTAVIIVIIIRITDIIKAVMIVLMKIAVIVVVTIQSTTVGIAVMIALMIRRRYRSGYHSDDHRQQSGNPNSSRCSVEPTK